MSVFVVHIKGGEGGGRRKEGGGRREEGGGRKEEGGGGELQNLGD